MAFVDRKGRVLTDSQVRVIIQMMQSSLQSHISKDSQIGDITKKQYEKRLAKLEKEYLKLAKSKKAINVEELLHQEHQNINEAPGAKEFKDVIDAYEISKSSFHLQDKPMEGIEKIPEYHSNLDRNIALHQLRVGNSITLSSDDVDERNQALSKLEKAAEFSRIKGAELGGKKGHTFEDIYNVFIGVNEFVGMEHRNGVNTMDNPALLFKVMSDIADYMNEIDETEDEKLRKTRVIQLAAFVYQIVIVARLYPNDSDLSSQLLADTILQAYGLPPHIPQKKTELTKTIEGELEFTETIEDEIEFTKKISHEIDFLDGAVVIMNGVEVCGEAIITESDYVSLKVEDRMKEDGQTIGKLLMKYKDKNIEVDNKVYDDIEQITRIVNTYPDNEFLHIACEETLQAMLKCVAEAKAETILDGIAKCYAKEIEHIVRKGTEAKKAVENGTKVESREQNPQIAGNDLQRNS